MTTGRSLDSGSDDEGEKTEEEKTNPGALTSIVSDVEKPEGEAEERY